MRLPSTRRPGESWWNVKVRTATGVEQNGSNIAFWGIADLARGMLTLALRVVSVAIHAQPRPRRLYSNFRQLVFKGSLAWARLFLTSAHGSRRRADTDYRPSLLRLQSTFWFRLVELAHEIRRDIRKRGDRKGKYHVWVGGRRSGCDVLSAALCVTMETAFFCDVGC